MDDDDDMPADAHAQVAAQTGYEHQRSGPSTAGYWIGAFFIVLAIGWFVYSLVSGLLGISDDMQYVSVPGTATIAVDEPGSTTIYFEHKGTIDGNPYVYGGSTAGLDITVVDPDGTSLAIGTPGFSEEYSLPSHSGTSLAEFDAPVAGDYEIAATINGDGDATPSYSLAIGSTGLLGIIVTSFAAAIPLVIGIVLIVVTAARRANAD